MTDRILHGGHLLRLQLRRDRDRATATAVTLQYDWNGDGASAASGMVNDPILCATGTACRGERVVYSFSSGALTRQEMGVDGSPVTIASGISSLAFTYFAEDGTVTTVPADIRTIGVSVTAQSANQGAYVTYVGSHPLRNR